MDMQMAGLGTTTKHVDETTFGEAASVALHTSPRPEPSYYLAATRRLKGLVEMLGKNWQRRRICLDQRDSQ